MKYLLYVIGGGWALLGFGNIVGGPWTEPGSETILVFSLIFNTVLFIIPGLGLAALGSLFGTKSR